MKRSLNSSMDETSRGPTHGNLICPAKQGFSEITGSVFGGKEAMVGISRKAHRTFLEYRARVCNEISVLLRCVKWLFCSILIQCSITGHTCGSDLVLWLTQGSDLITVTLTSSSCEVCLSV